MVLGARPYLYWPFNDAATQMIGAEQSGNNQASFNPANEPFFSPAPTYGVASVPNIGETQLFLPASAYYATPGENSGNNVPGTFATINYPSGSMGTWGAWITPGGGQVFVLIGLNGGSKINFGVNGSGRFYAVTPQGNLVTASAAAVGVPQYVQVVVTYASPTTLTIELFVGGVSQGTASDTVGYSNNYQRTPEYVALNAGAASGFTISHLSHTPTPVPEYLLGLGTEAGLVAATVATTYGASLGTLPTDLSASPAGPQSGSSSALEKLNDVIRSEQGYLSCTTTGSLLAPVQAITVRARTRSASPDYTFDAQTELANQPDFLRDLTNLVVTETAQGPSTSTTYLDPSASVRAGSANNADQVVLTQYVDQLGFAQDRILRGKNAALRIASFTVDALTTPTDRSSDLLAIKMGDRLRVANIPVTVIGADHWDGWVIGRAEAHDRDQHRFTFHLQPVLPPTAVYDTDLYANGGALTISSLLTSGATSMAVASADGVTWFERVQVPYVLLVESEQVLVTAAAAPSAGTQTLSITRAQGGTSATAHAVGVAPEVVTPSIFAF
jgi:hypothetical protein